MPEATLKNGFLSSCTSYCNQSINIAGVLQIVSRETICSTPAKKIQQDVWGLISMPLKMHSYTGTNK
jgi:hypothetical protein